MIPPRGAEGRARGLPYVLWVVLAAALLALAAQLGLLTSTETRYAEIGREMFASGDVVVPTLNAAPHLEKPPLAYWALAATFAAFGVSDVVAHVPGLLAGLCTLLVTAGVVRRLAGANDPDPRGRGRAGALVLATMPAFVAQSYLVMTEPWLVLVTTLAGAAVLESWRTSGRPGLRWTLLLHAALGAGMLVKGPAVFVVPLAGAAAAAIGSKCGRILRPFVHPLGLVLFVAIAAPWYVAANARIPGLLDTYLTKRLFGAVVSSADFHDRPPWVVWLPLLGTAPWLGGALEAAKAVATAGGRRSALVPLVAMGLAAPVFFTISASRLFSYASPAFPWIAALVAAGAPAAGAAQAGAALRFRAGLRGATIATALVAIVVAGATFVLASPGPGVAGLAVVAAGLAVALAFGRPRRGPLAGVGAQAAAAGLVLVLAAGALAAADPARAGSDRALARALVAHRKPGEDVGVLLQKDGVWGLLPFYGEAPVTFFSYPPRVGPPGADPSAWGPAAGRFLPIEDLTAWFRAPARRWLLVRASQKSVERNPWVLLAPSGPIVGVAKNERYALITNLPLPDR